jgi:hypothetical protein
LARGSVGVLGERLEARNEVAVHEAEEVAELARLKLPALGTVRRGPIAPAIGSL